MDRMRFGIMSFATAPYEDLARRFRTAEEFGFASGWVNDDIPRRGRPTSSRGRSSLPSRARPPACTSAPS